MPRPTNRKPPADTIAAQLKAESGVIVAAIEAADADVAELREIVAACQKTLTDARAELKKVEALAAAGRLKLQSHLSKG